MRGVKSIASAVLVLGGGVLLVSCGSRGPSSGAGNGAQLKTVWGEPDLQGIWTLETDTPLQRPARFKDKTTLTEQERVELDKQRAALLGRDKRVERGTELDVAGAYSQVFNTVKHTGPRTSLIIDPRERADAAADARSAGARGRRSRVPHVAAAGHRHVQEQHDRLRGGKYDPQPSPRLNEIPDRYNRGG